MNATESTLNKSRRLAIPGLDEPVSLELPTDLARLATRLVYPTVGLAWHSRTPRALMRFAAEILASGIGDPAIFNDELITDALQDHGVTRQDACDYMNSTCVEIKVVGASNMWVTAPYFNCPQGLLEVMVEVAGGKRSAPATFEELQQLVRANLADKIRTAAQSLDRNWKERERSGCFPLASCFVRDCLERGIDFDRGGACYNWVENSFVGLANLVDSLTSVKALVFDQKRFSLGELHRIVSDNFAGHEDLRQEIVNSLPKYGNDNDAADRLACEWVEFLAAETESHTVGLHRYVPGFFCWVMHENFGRETGATPDGRSAGRPLADGAGPAQGREFNGPTAAVLSTTKWSHRKALDGVVHNLKFSENLLGTSRARIALVGVLETYLKRGGFEIQVNVVGQDALREAQRRPECSPDLLVRIAGYSDYFTHLNRSMQDEVISRTEHEL